MTLQRITLDQLKLKILFQIAYLNNESQAPKAIRRAKIEQLEQVLRWINE